MTHLIIKTTNSGESWNQIQTNIFQGTQGVKYFKKVKFLDEYTGYAILGLGASLPSPWTSCKIYKTVDGGYSWNDLNIPSSSHFSDFLFLQNKIYLCGGVITPLPEKLNGHIFVSNDEGNTWNRINGNNDPYFDRLLKIGNIFIASSNNMILKSTNEGISWIPIYIFERGALFLDMTFFNYQNALAIKNSFTPQISKTIILKTTNAGVTFVQQNNSSTPENFLSTKTSPTLSILLQRFHTHLKKISRSR